MNINKFILRIKESFRNKDDLDKLITASFIIKKLTKLKADNPTVYEINISEQYRYLNVTEYYIGKKSTFSQTFTPIDNFINEHNC